MKQRGISRAARINAIESAVKIIPFSAFWLRSSVVSVLISLISDTWAIGEDSPQWLAYWNLHASPMRYTTAMAWRVLQFPIKIHRSGLLLESSCLFDMIYLFELFADAVVESDRFQTPRYYIGEIFLPMLRSGGSGVSADEPDVLENSADPEEQVDVDGDNEAEETMEEEVEYEEVEEEEEIEEEVGEEDSQKGSDGAEEIDEERKHAELLALPPHGTEVYLGGIPPDASEEDLKELCEYIGAVTEVRIMKGKDSSESRGYAFVSFRSKELACKAIEELNNTEFKGKKVKCSTSQADHKLFIGNVPRNWGEENMKKAVKKTGPGVNLVELLKLSSSLSLDNCLCASASHCAVIFLKSFILGSQGSLCQEFTRRHYSGLSKAAVRASRKSHKSSSPPAKPGHEKSRFGFVHFAERSSAMKALKNTEKYEIDGQVLDCSLAKPHTDQKPSGGPNSKKSSMYSNFPPTLGYGLDGGAYCAFGAGFGAAGFRRFKWIKERDIYKRACLPVQTARAKAGSDIPLNKKEEQKLSLEEGKPRQWPNHKPQEPQKKKGSPTRTPG
uniref:RRM domain-containing protein n=1 Tax=Salix viminalis TaxID=40686 RepID=A0A6N2MVM7_SALVM